MTQFAGNTGSGEVLKLLLLLPKVHLKRYENHDTRTSKT